MPRKTAKAAANHLRAWREYRGLTQDQLARKVGTAGNVIGLLEAGERGLSDKWLNRLAPALDTRPGYLLDYDPNEIDPGFIEAAMEAPPEARALALQILKGFKADKAR